MVSPVGEPGSGKSTFSLGLCHTLKMSGIRAEFVPEVIKHEVFTPQGVSRVISGKYDARYLRAQHALTRGLVGATEVIVNDGALEPFLYYASQRMSSKALGDFRRLLDRFRKEQSVAQHQFVALDLGLGYDQVGRNESREQALESRGKLFDMLYSEFGIRPEVLTSPQQIQTYTQQLIEQAKAMRTIPRPKIK